MTSEIKSLVKVIYKTNLKKDLCFIANSYKQDKIKQISSWFKISKNVTNIK